MKALVFYRQTPGTNQNYHDFMKRLKRDFKYEEIDVDSVHGAPRAELYDVLSYPAVVLIDNEGRALARWQTDLPDPAELSQYLYL